jgi:hypothetical protein
MAIKEIGAAFNPPRPYLLGIAVRPSDRTPHGGERRFPSKAARLSSAAPRARPEASGRGAARRSRITVKAVDHILGE